MNACHGVRKDETYILNVASLCDSLSLDGVHYSKL